MIRRPRRSARRAIISLTGVIALVAGLLVAVAAPASAAGTRAFGTPIFTANTTGDIVIRGNTLMTCPAGSKAMNNTGVIGTTTCESVQTAAASGGNNYFLMGYTDVDADSSTFNSSSATVDIPTGATVLYAGLSWAANTGPGSLTATNGSQLLVGVAAPNASLKTSASFKAPGASSYTTVTSTQDDGGINYQEYADVTSTVVAAGAGTYTMANVQAGTGGNSYAGWSLTIAYSKSTLPYRNLVVWTGYDTVGDDHPVAINVSGFLTPATGHVVSRVGVVSYEGDYGSGGDAIALAGTDLFNNLNPLNDAFNSSLTDLNVAVTDRSPAYANLLGMDIDRFEASGILANAATSTTINLHTGNDFYYPGVVTFATDLYPADLTGVKTVTDANGGSVSRGDRLDYSTVITSIGLDAAVANVLTDAIPFGTTYIPGSLKIDGTAVSDAGEVVGGNVTVRLGTGATGTAGGRLAIGASTTVSFGVVVSSTIVDATVISSIAIFSYSDETGGAGHTGASNTTASTAVVLPNISTGAALGSDIGVPYSKTLALGTGSGVAPFAWSVTGGTLPAWVTLSSAGVLTGTPTAIGASTFTVQVSDTHGHTGTKQFTLTTYAAPSVSTTTVGPGLVGVASSRTFNRSGGSGTFTWSVDAGSLPPGLLLGTTGVLSGNPTTAGTYSFTVRVTDTAGGDTGTAGGSGTKAFTYVVGTRPALTYTSPLSQGVVDVAYSSELTEAGGVGTITWSITAGTLPAGLTMSASTGILSGTPTAAGTSSFTVTVTDSYTPTAQTASKATTMTVFLGPSLTFPAPPSGEVTVPYSTTFTAAGGTSNVWSISSGSLPAGLTLNPATGAVTGTPTAASTETFTVRVVGSDGTGNADTRVASITIVPAPSITSGAPANGVVGSAYSTTFTATGGVGTYTWSVDTGALPAGLTLNSATGELTGTPSAAGTTAFTIRATDTSTGFGTQAVSLLIIKSATSVSLSSSTGPVHLGTAITLTSEVSPSSGTGTVTFTVVPTTGPQAGTSVSRGSGTISDGIATLAVTLPTFGASAITASYEGDSTHAAATSSIVTVEVAGYAGEVIVTEFRSSGPDGTSDSYTELYNTGPAVPLAGFVVATSSGASTTLPVDAGILATGRSYLLTGSSFSLGGIAGSDLSDATLGTGGIKVSAPDTAATQTDAVGPATDFHLGTGLPAMTAGATDQYAWVRLGVAGRPKDTGDNAADFKLVSDTGAVVGGVQSTRGSASPTGLTNPFQRNEFMQSVLLDPSVTNALPPNRTYATGTLVIRRTITNSSDGTITAAKVRVTALSEADGAPLPGVALQPTRRANLRVVNPGTPSSVVTVAGRGDVTVHNLSVDSPIVAASGGGLNSTLTVPLPLGGLPSGSSVDVAFTFQVDTGGTFWFGYDVDAK